MNKFLGYSLLTAVCVLLSGCAATAHAEDDKPRSGYVNEDLTVKSGYYTCEDDDSYIHIDGNMIEICNYDYYAHAEKNWNSFMGTCDDEEREKQAPNHDSVIEYTVSMAKESYALQEFVVYTFPLSTFDPERSDRTVLVLNYEFAKEHDTYSGYTYNDDGSISIGDLYYCYDGEELPV